MGLKGTHCLIEVIDDKNSMMRIGIDRIRDYFPGSVDIIHHAASDSERSRYSLIILLGKFGDMKELDNV